MVVKKLSKKLLGGSMFLLYEDLDLFKKYKNPQQMQQLKDGVDQVSSVGSMVGNVGSGITQAMNGITDLLMPLFFMQGKLRQAGIL